MNIPEIIETIRIGMMKAGLGTLALIVGGGALFAQWSAARKPVVATWRRLGWSGKAVVTGLCAACIFFAGGKTRGVRGVVGTPITPEEIAQGYRLESVVTNEAVTYSMPAGGTEYARWSLRGGRETRFAFDLGDFYFPYGTGVVHRFDVLSGGTIESLPRPSLATISAAREWASLVPGEGRFWSADAMRPPSAPDQNAQGVKLLTWEGVYAGQDHTGPYNAQIELCSGGGFAIRSNNVERVYRRVPSFDWDDDGLENSVDPDPLMAGPDAHGTNAEWYNAVCSNIVVSTPGGNGVSPFHLEWLENVNSNAYYFVDVVTDRGPAPIYFTGDRDSRLGNPVVVARAGETNHVPLLIGISYAVTSTVPFMVSVPDEYMYPEVQTNEPCVATIRWPLNFVFTESVGAFGRVYAVTVEPYDPGGVLEWNGNVPMRGAPSGGDCDCVQCSGYSVSFACSSTCTCGGGCGARGNYLFELASFSVEGGECRCGFDDPPGDHPPCPHNPNDGPSLTVAFSDVAVIFEDAYEDEPGVTKPRRSTRVRLTIDAYGGPNGGTLLLMNQNFGSLVKVDGDVFLPYGQQLTAGESFHATGVFEGGMSSETANDVRVLGSFVETGTSANINDDASLTVVRVELSPRVVAPRNVNPHRHYYGVCELVQYTQEPLSPVITWNPVGGGSNEVYAGSAHYRCPLDGCENPLRAEIGSIHYTPLIDVLEPLGVESVARSHIVYSNAVNRGEAGGIGMELCLYITPLEVSFSEIAVEEVPCLTYEAEGYFENPYFNGAFAHTGGKWGAGAGRWADVDKDNKFGDHDEAAYNDKIPWLTPSGTPTTNVAYAWTDGCVYIDNPFGWHVKGTGGDASPHKVFGEYIQDTIMLDSYGRVGVWKLNNWVIRTTNDVVTLFGPKEQKQ